MERSQEVSGNGSKPSELKKLSPLAHQQDGAKRNGLARAQVAICQHPTNNGHHEHKCGVSAVKHRGALIGEQKVLGKLKNQQSAHTVVGEALPHFREEQDHETARMAEYGVPGTFRRGIQHVLPHSSNGDLMIVSCLANSQRRSRESSIIKTERKYSSNHNMVNLCTGSLPEMPEELSVLQSMRYQCPITSDRI